MESNGDAVFGAPAKRRSFFDSSCSVPNTSFWKNQFDGRVNALDDIFGKIINKEVMSSISCEDRPLKSSDNTLSGSRVKVQVETHPLRWDSATNTPRLEAHKHPLRLIHSKHLYPFNKGEYICDVGRHRCFEAGYVFNCPECEFDICLTCVAEPCLNCTDKTCSHTQIKISMV